MTYSPIIFQLLTITSTGCLLLALLIGREHVRKDRGLRRGLLGLLSSALTGVVLAFDPPHYLVWPLAGLMAGGIVVLITNMAPKAKDNGDSLRTPGC